MMQVTATNVNTGGDIQNEKVNYMGYYSTHEQSMETVVDIQSKMTESDLKSIFSNGKHYTKTAVTIIDILNNGYDKLLRFENIILDCV